MTSKTTHEIETPVGKHKVVLNDWLTGGEKRSMAALKDDNDRGAALVKNLIVSVDGKSEDVLAAVDAMHGKDFDFVLYELTTIAEGSSLEKKTS